MFIRAASCRVENFAAHLSWKSNYCIFVLLLLILLVFYKNCCKTGKKKIMLLFYEKTITEWN